MVVRCCVCEKVRIDGRWKRSRQVEPPGEAISHSYCPTCYERVRREFQLEASRIASTRAEPVYGA